MLRAAALGVQTQQTVAKLPIWNLALAMQQARDMALNSVDRSSDLRLCQAGFHEFGDDLFPHVTIIMILFPSVNISAGILSKIYQESVDIGKHNPDNELIATQQRRGTRCKSDNKLSATVTRAALRKFAPASFLEWLSSGSSADRFAFQSMTLSLSNSKERFWKRPAVRNPVLTVGATIGNQMAAGKTAEIDSEARGHKPNF